MLSLRTIAFAALLSLTSCALSTKNNFISEIDRPVKNQGNYTRVGPSVSADIVDGTYKVMPLGTFDVWLDVSKRVETYIIPILWRVLLTGEQFNEDMSLKRNQLHISILGGVNQIAYSDEEGFQMSMILSPIFKYLINDMIWIHSNSFYQYSFKDTYDTHGINLNATIGYQIAKRISIEGVINNTNVLFTNFSNVIEDEKRYGRLGLGAGVRFRPFDKHEIATGYTADVPLKEISYNNNLDQEVWLSYNYIFKIK